MKKIMKSVLVAMVAIAGLSLSSCGEYEYDYTPAQAEGTAASAYLYSEQGTSLSFTPADANNFIVKVARPNSSEAASVQLSSTNSNFTVPSTVSFAAGEKEKDVPVTFNIGVGTTESTTIALASENSYTYGADSLTVSVKLDYNWYLMGNGVLTSWFFGESWEQPVYKAREANVYKLTDAYVTGYDLIFELTADGQHLAGPIEATESGHVHSSYGMVYFRNVNTEDASLPMYDVTVDGNVIELPLQWIVSAGSFGWGVEVIELPE